MRRKQEPAVVTRVTQLGLASLTKACAVAAKLYQDTGLVFDNAVLSQKHSGARLPIRFNTATKEYEIEWSR